MKFLRYLPIISNESTKPGRCRINYIQLYEIGQKLKQKCIRCINSSGMVPGAFPKSLENNRIQTGKLITQIYVS